MRSTLSSGSATAPAAASPSSAPATPAPVLEALSIDETCRVSGIGRTKVYELIRDGILPTVKLGKRRLVRPGTLRRVLASLEHAGITRAP